MGRKNMKVNLCSACDVPKLAEMNKYLIEDEKSDNPMQLVELEHRMSEFLDTDYNAYLFVEENDVVGYALVRKQEDGFYLRQFYIDRDHRKKHFGTAAFKELIKILNTDNIFVDVLPWNERGLSFWKSLGFKEAAISMKLK
jgi:ribosomal protein S18 acetylase RimI-like enzyme